MLFLFPQVSQSRFFLYHTVFAMKEKRAILESEWSKYTLKDSAMIIHSVGLVNCENRMVVKNLRFPKLGILYAAYYMLEKVLGTSALV